MNEYNNIWNIKVFVRKKRFGGIIILLSVSIILYKKFVISDLSYPIQKQMELIGSPFYLLLAS